jgi:bifunctional oligoribonuclease and PAP phosphatase NrnA
MSVNSDRSFSQDWEPIRNLIDRSDRFLIATHVNADPDALGSELALAEGLRHLGKHVQIVNPTVTSKNYDFLDPDHEADEYVPGKSDSPDLFDAIFIMDISRWERLGILADPIRLSKRPKTCIDHHPYTGGFADFHLVNTNACASAEIVYDLLRYLDIPINQRIAECIYVSILADTGGFTFSNTNQRTHQIVAELLNYGINPRMLHEKLYQNHSAERLKFMGNVLSNLQFDCDTKLAWMSVSKEMLDEHGMTLDDLEGFVDIPRNCKNVLLSILFSEVAPEDIKISLRSKGDFHSSKIANQFGGGGHHHASGIRMQGPLDEVEELILNTARKELSNFAGPH